MDQVDHSIKTVQDNGIAVHALIVFGLPDDKADLFDKTVQYLNQQAVAIVEFFIDTPYQDTPFILVLLNLGVHRGFKFGFKDGEHSQLKSTPTLTNKIIYKPLRLLKSGRRIS